MSYGNDSVVDDRAKSTKAGGENRKSEKNKGILQCDSNLRYASKM